MYKKQCRHLKQPYADEAGCYNGYYYSPAGVEVTSCNWKDVCEWTVEDQVLLWVQAAFDGDGLTAGASKQAVCSERTARLLLLLLLRRSAPRDEEECDAGPDPSE